MQARETTPGSWEPRSDQRLLQVVLLPHQHISLKSAVTIYFSALDTFHVGVYCKADGGGLLGRRAHCSESPAVKRAHISAPRTAHGAAVAMRGFNRWLPTRAAV